MVRKKVQNIPTFFLSYQQVIYDESVLAEDLESILDLVQSADVSFSYLLFRLPTF